MDISNLSLEECRVLKRALAERIKAFIDQQKTARSFLLNGKYGYRPQSPHIERDAEIVALKASGSSYRAVASKFGISSGRVEQIVKREERRKRTGFYERIRQINATADPAPRR